MKTSDQMPPLALKLKAVATELRLGVRALARAASISPTAMFALLNTGAWPVRARREDIEAELLKAVTDAGATQLQLTNLFTQTPDPTLKEPDMLMPKQRLTREAQSAFKLFTNPFDGEVTSAGEMFSNTEFKYCREACWQAAAHGRFVAVIGESGAGKTTLLGDLEERIATDRKQVLVIKPSVLAMEDNDVKGKTLKVSAIIDAIIYTIDPTATPKRTHEGRSRQLQDLLEDSAKAGNAHLLMIEEAHALPIPTLKHLKRLHELRMGRKPLLGILLLGQTELARKLSPTKHDVREVAQRCEIVHLLPLDGDLKQYIVKRLERAKKPFTEVMDDDAVDAIRSRLTVRGEDTRGNRVASISLVYPLAVNNFVTAALNTAAALGVPRVTRDVVMGV